MDPQEEAIVLFFIRIKPGDRGVGRRVGQSLEVSFAQAGIRSHLVVEVGKPLGDSNLLTNVARPAQRPIGNDGGAGNPGVAQHLG